MSTEKREIDILRGALLRVGLSANNATQSKESLGAIARAAIRQADELHAPAMPRWLQVREIFFKSEPDALHGELQFTVNNKLVSANKLSAYSIQQAFAEAMQKLVEGDK